MSDAISMSLFVYGLAIIVAMGAALLIKLIVGALALAESRAPATTAPVAAPSPAAVAAGLIPEHHLVAIAAAAYVMVGAHRIVHIGHVSNGPVWSTEGRLAHHGSHRPSSHH